MQLPQFDQPPVEEVSLGVHFQPLSSLHLVHIGALAQEWSGDYPETEEWPAMPPASDEDAPLPKPGVQVQVLDRVPFPRIWFVSRDQTLVRQIQRDRFVQNWRREYRIRRANGVI